MSFNLRAIRTAVFVLMPLASLSAFGAFRTAHCAIPIARSELPRETAVEASPDDLFTLVAGNTEFAIDAYGLLGNQYKGHNLFFSPYSISIALSMAYAGARGKTADEMARAMRFLLPRERLHRAFGVLDAQVSSRSADGVVLQAANSMWAREKTHFEKPFLDTLAQSYGAGVRLVNFAGDPEGSRKRINAWVADQTRDQIRELLRAGAVDGSTVLMLTNAVYFRGDWLHPFEPDHTAPRVFSRLDGSAAKVSTMHAPMWGAGLSQSAAFDAVELRYRGGNVAMDIVMPRAGSFAAFESGLTGASLEAILKGLNAEQFELFVPKFKLKGASGGVKEVLRALGMDLAFDPQEADFSGVTSDSVAPLFLREVIHSATVTVDEKGTEAAAATAFDGVRAGRPLPIEIRIDHPFFFFIRDVPTGAILFAGRVTDPTEG